MTIAVSNYHSVSSHHSDSTAVAVFAPSQNDVQSTTPTKGLSLFELLLAEKIGPETKSTTAEGDQNSASTVSSGTTQKSHAVTSHNLKVQSTLNADGTTASSWVNLTPPSTEAATQTNAPTSSSTSQVSPVGGNSNDGSQASRSTSTASNATAGKSLKPITVDGTFGQTSASATDSRPADSTPQKTVSDEVSSVDPTSDSLATASALDATLPSASTKTLNLSENRVASIIPFQNLSPAKFDTVSRVGYGASAAITASNAASAKVAASSDSAEAIQKIAPRPHLNSRTDSYAAANAVVVPMTSVVKSSGDTLSPLSEEIATAITQNLGDDTIQGPTSVRIRLDRPDLGTVHLHLSVSDNVVSIRITTDDASSQQLVQSQIDDLRQTLTNRGIECGQFQVGCGSSGHQSADGNQSNRSTNRVGNALNSRWARPQILQLPVSRPSGMLNFVA